jgi:hypothetical protein
VRADLNTLAPGKRVAVIYHLDKFWDFLLKITNRHNTKFLSQREDQAGFLKTL